MTVHVIFPNIATLMQSTLKWLQEEVVCKIHWQHAQPHLFINNQAKVNSNLEQLTFSPFLPFGGWQTADKNFISGFASS